MTARNAKMTDSSTTGGEKGGAEKTEGDAPPISLAGAGNWFVAHDRVGPRVMELATNRYGPEVELCDVGVSGLRLLDWLRGQELLIVVDAGNFSPVPGKIRVQEMDGSIATGDGVTTVHQIGPLEVLDITARLYPENLPHRVLLVTVETTGITPEQLELSCQQIIPIIDRIIDEWGQARKRRLTTDNRDHLT